MSWLLVAIGLLLLMVGLRSSRQARSYRLAMQSLLALGTQDMDPLDIPHAAWPALQAVGWYSLGWEGDWFGAPVQGRLGQVLTPRFQKKHKALTFNIESGGDVLLHLHLHHVAPRGENRLYAEQLARVFVLLMEGRLRSRTEALSVALAGRARLSLYLQHDTRNLAQWVSWVSADFAASTTPEALMVAAKRLQENAPLARERAQRLTQALGRQQQMDVPRRIDLLQAVTQAARLAGIEPRISGKADVFVPDSLLSRALDNLFSNLATGWREALSRQPTLQIEPVRATAEHGELVKLEFVSPWPDPSVRIPQQKLFEPFASGRPGGLGLGLYQARKSLREAGGDLQAQPTPDGLSFLLTLPAPAR